MGGSMGIEKEFEVKPKNPVSVEKLQAIVREAKAARVDYDDKYKISSAAYKVYRELELIVLEALQETGLTKFHVKGLGTAFIITKLKAKYPKLTEDKIKVMAWIEKKHGSDVLNSFLTIHAQSFASFYNGELKAASEKGEFLKMPGIEAPTKQETIGFRKDK